MRHFSDASQVLGSFNYLSSKAMKEISDKYIEITFAGQGQGEFKFRQFEYNYKKYFPEDRDGKILDIGIGKGEMLACMKNWGYKTYLGVDVSSSAIRYCESIGLNCMLVDDTIEWLRGHEGVFSLVTVIDVLEHIKKEDTLNFLKAMKNALIENGILIIQVPNLQSPDGYLHRYNDITHEVGYVEHSLNQVLLAAGFSDIIFGGFEEFVSGGVKECLKKKLRGIFWSYTRFARIISGNLNPRILHPVFYSVVKNV